MILLPGMCFIVSFLLLCCKHVVNISYIVLFFILYDMYVLPIGVIKNIIIIIIIEQVFQCTTKVILLTKMIKLWTFHENVVHS